MLSIVIPTLNAEQGLKRLLAQTVNTADQMVISDGGSVDGTLQAAVDCTVIQGPAGRGEQLKRGAEYATGDWLLFLHADSLLTDDWQQIVSNHMTSDPNQAMVFRLRFDDDHVMARLLERIVRLRCWLLAMPYGDQGLLISRQLYDEIGGFQDIPIMEDVDIVRRVGRQRLTFSQHEIITCADKYRRKGYLRRMFRNLYCLCLYHLGVAPEKIRKVYAS